MVAGRCSPWFPDRSTLGAITSCLEVAAHYGKCRCGGTRWAHGDLFRAFWVWLFLSFLCSRLTTPVFACVPMNGHVHAVITYSGWCFHHVNGEAAGPVFHVPRCNSELLLYVSLFLSLFFFFKNVTIFLRCKKNYKFTPILHNTNSTFTYFGIQSAYNFPDDTFKVLVWWRATIRNFPL